MKKSRVIDFLFSLAIAFLFIFPSAVFLFYGFRQHHGASNVSSNQKGENSEWLEIVWIADWLTPAPRQNEKYENFTAYLWWPDNAEFLRIRWIAFDYNAKGMGWWWQLENGKILYSESNYFGYIDSLPEWLLPHIPEFSLSEMDTPTGRRTVAKIVQKEYWDNIQYNINVWIRIPRRVAENREFTGIELQEKVDLQESHYWNDKTYFYFDYDPNKPMRLSFHLNLGDGAMEGIYMGTCLWATVFPKRWVRSDGSAPDWP